MALKVYFLGTGDAFGSGGRLNTALALVNGERSFLLDCGASILPAAFKAGLDLTGVEAVGFTHAHGDHITGWPFLRLYYQFMKPRSSPITVIAPTGVAKTLEQLASMLYPELDSFEPGYDIMYHTVTGGSTLSVGDVELQAISVYHQKDHPSVGYRVTWGGRTMAFSGDATWSEGLINLADGVDLFVCECSDFEDGHPVHVSYRQIEANASRLNCKKLILTHCGLEVLARESELAWPIAKDGMVVEV